MAATLPRILSVGKTTKGLLSCLRLSAVPAQQYMNLVSVDWIIPFTAYLLQVYNQNDVRRARFIGRQKEVNENFAISLAAEEPVTYLESRVVSCDGGGGAIGHPRDKETKSGTCGYCGLQFKQKHHH
uniref:NADH dehydrogenase [ubiquinone] iron-sulfur protein 6, mitochondrial-like n=1 Tax=Sinocyclocheilus grahami TaxID=75366 RepID=A0A672LN49_SINGR